MFQWRKDNLWKELGWEDGKRKNMDGCLGISDSSWANCKNPWNNRCVFFAMERRDEESEAVVVGHLILLSLICDDCELNLG